MTIRYVCAGDRLNYGDFLFPLIFKEYFQQSSKIEYYGIVESDYSNFGALPTKSYRTLVREIDVKKDVIVIGGGEVFFGDWINLFGYINSIYSTLMGNRLLRKIEQLLKISRLVLGGGRNRFPFVPAFNCEKIFIGAGGQFHSGMKDEEKRYLTSNLKHSKYLSVRDLRTKKSLLEFNIHSDLIPDSAVLMSKIFPLEVLKEKISNAKVLAPRPAYIFLQVGNNKGPVNRVQFIKSINQLAERRNYKIICCPIGLAPGHEDDIILNELCKLDASWELISPNNIFEIMHLVANSSLYVGTSLHGAITAFCFNKPIIALNKKVRKTSSFVESWCSEFYEKTIDFEEIGVKGESILAKWNADKARTRLSECQQAVENYFSRVAIHLKDSHK